jgi:phosphoglycerol transferase MdoB-like AlkP superfamily enzyme
LSWNQVLKAALLPTIGTVLIMIVFFNWLPDKELPAQLLNTVFITLFALTVPHLFLTRVYNGRVRKPKLIKPNK